MKVLPPDQAAAVPVRDAATVLVVQDGHPGPPRLQVLMVRRSPHASFMPGAHVFPGGAVEPADAQAACTESPAALAQRVGAVTQVGPRALAFAVAALRECREECGLTLGGAPGQTQLLQPWAHWVTPLGLPKRFDTLFFVAPAPAGQQPRPDQGETTALEWVQPAHALAEYAAGRFAMEFATAHTVRSLLPFASSAALLAHAAAHTHLPPLQPRLRLDAAGRIAAIVLPGEPGYGALAG